MGAMAFKAGKFEATIHKPFKATAKLLESTQKKFFKDRVAFTARGTIAPGTEVNRLMDEWQEKRQEGIAAEMAKRSAAKGYNISPNTINTIAKQLNSEKPEEFIKGLETIGRNRRLMSIVEGE